jgi:hypothetical protein
MTSLRELGEWEHGMVGYRGVQPDGTKYGAPLNGTWCDQFYHWTSHTAFPAGFVTMTNPNAIPKYFQDVARDGKYFDAFGALTNDLNLAASVDRDDAFYYNNTTRFNGLFADPVLGDLTTAGLGDMLSGAANGASHIARFLAYDATHQRIVSVDGNWGNEVRVMYRSAVNTVGPDYLYPYWRSIGRLDTSMF